MNSGKNEARTNIKRIMKLGQKNGEIINALQKVYGDNAPRKSAIYKWIIYFKMGQDNVEDDATAADHPHQFKSKTILSMP